MHRKNGFTIVELLVVIVVIGILAAVVIISYNGVRAKAIDASIQSDASNAAKILENDKTLSATNTYPANAAAANSGKGLPSGSGNTFTYTPDNSSSTPSYTLKVSRSGSSNSYQVTNTNPVPTLVTESAPTITLQPVSWIDYSHTFTVTATGNPSPTVQWQRSVDNSTWTNISGATSTSYPSRAGDSQPCVYIYFRAIFTNSAGTATTNSAYLTGPCSD